MKAIVESPLLNHTSKSLEIFAEILTTITSCRNEKELYDSMELVKKLCNPIFIKFFEYGFEYNHMWVKESERNERLIFVEL